MSEHPQMRKVSVAGTPVTVYEANWSALSSPDNPPRARLGIDVAQEIGRTVMSAWSSGLALRGIVRQGSRIGSYVTLGLLLVMGLTVTSIIVESGVLSSGWPALDAYSRAMLEPSPAPESSWLATATGMFMALIVIVASVAWYRSDALAAIRQPWLIPLTIAVSVVLAAATLPLLYLGAMALLTLTLLTLFGLLLSAVARVIASVVRGLTTGLARARLSLVARWLNRITWVVLVLPVQTIQQLNKAFGNIISILLLDRGARVKWKAMAYGVLLTVGSLILLVVCEVLVLIPLLAFFPFFPDAEAGKIVFSLSDKLIFTALMLPVCLLVLKGLLPAVDLLLDITNYQLATTAEKLEYQAPIEEAVAELASAGCGEVYVLAHSLGSVLVYDWLRRGTVAAQLVVGLYTIGSPLNKFWFIDRTQSQRLEAAGDLGSSRLRSWKNYWALSDPVSGALRQYGDRVKNRRLRWLGILLVSHVSYWGSRVVLDDIRQVITSRRRNVDIA